MEIRILTLDDFLSYKMIRLELLKNNPSYFGSSFAEENLFEDSMWINRLTKTNVKTFGLFDNNTLVGITTTVMNPRSKIKHIASLNSMYVKPSYRGQGYGAKLINKVIEFLDDNAVEIINLSVVTTNNCAINLYKTLGFNVYGEEKQGIKLNNKYMDLLLMTKSIKKK